MGIVCALHINRKVRLHIEETMRDNYVTAQTFCPRTAMTLAELHYVSQYFDSGGQPEFQSIPFWLLNGSYISAQIVVQMHRVTRSEKHIICKCTTLNTNVMVIGRIAIAGRQIIRLRGASEQLDKLAEMGNVCAMLMTRKWFFPRKKWWEINSLLLSVDVSLCPRTPVTLRAPLHSTVWTLVHSPISNQFLPGSLMSGIKPGAKKHILYLHLLKQLYHLKYSCGSDWVSIVFAMGIHWLDIL